MCNGDTMNKKILWLSDSPLVHTGYANQSMHILNGLSDNYECHQLAHNAVTQPLPPGLTFRDGSRLNYTLHGAGREAYCKDLILPKIAELQPSFFIVLLDTFMLYNWILQYNFSPAKSIFYFPSDGGGGLPQACDHILKHFNHAVAMSRFGQRQAKEVHNLDVHYIPHAVNPEMFYQMSPPRRNKVKQEMEVISVNGTRIKGFLKDKFVVGTVARNQGRKMLDRTIKAFKLFCQDKPNAVLFMHSDPMDAAAVFDIRHLIVRHGLQNRVCFSPIRYFSSFDIKEMNKVYNAMDIFFLSTSGEGFGIPIIEAMSCQLPVVATDYTTTHELLMEDGVSGIPVPLACEMTGSWAVERAVMDDVKGAEALSALYKDEKLRASLALAGRSKVEQHYSWDVILPKWQELLAYIDQDIQLMHMQPKGVVV